MDLMDIYKREGVNPELCDGISGAYPLSSHSPFLNLPISEKAKAVPWEEKVCIVEEIKSYFRFK